MPTYIYETTGKGKKRRYEIRQGIKEDALQHHPETGEAIRRVVAGGGGIISRGAGRATLPCGKSPAAAAHRCGAGCCCGCK